MYTVIRFISQSPETLPVLDKVVKTFAEAKSPEKCAGEIRRLRRVSLSVSHAKNPLDHVEKIFRYIKKHRRRIRRFVDAGLRVCLDIALEPEDKKGRNYFDVGFSPEFMGMLCENEIELDVTMY